MKTFRILNKNGDIEVSIYKKANAVFQTNKYDELADIIYKVKNYKGEE